MPEAKHIDGALEFALSREMINDAVVAWDYDKLGWNELARFVALR